jgi:hypothetical protein
MELDTNYLRPTYPLRNYANINDEGTMTKSISEREQEESFFKRLHGGELAIFAVFLIKSFEIVVCYSIIISALIQDFELATPAFWALGLRRIGMIIGNLTFHSLTYRLGSRIVMMIGVLPLIAQSMLLFIVRQETLS